MSELSNEQATIRRLAAARAARAAVDKNGRPQGDPSRFTYDEAGRLISTDRGEGNE